MLSCSKLCRRDSNRASAQRSRARKSEEARSAQEQIRHLEEHVSYLQGLLIEKDAKTQAAHEYSIRAQQDL
jgi:Basic region leucine zipper